MDADPGYHPQEDDQVDADMEQAQLRLEQLRKEKEEVESSRRRLEETHLRKARFMDQQNELGDRMVNAADLIGGRWKAFARKARSWSRFTWP